MALVLVVAGGDYVAGLQAADLGDRGSVDMEDTVKKLASGRPQEQLAASTALSELGKPAVKPLLKFIEMESDPEKRARIGETLRSILRNPLNRDSETLSELIRLAQTSDYFLASPALACIGLFRGSEAIEAVHTIMRENPNPQTRGFAIGTLLLISGNDSREISTIKPLLKDESKAVQITAAGHLGELGDQSGMPLCLEALGVKERDRKALALLRRAAWAAGQIGNPAFIQPLERLLNDKRADSISGHVFDALAEVRLRNFSSPEQKLLYLKGLLGQEGHGDWSALHLARDGSQAARQILTEAASTEAHPGRAAAQYSLVGRQEAD